MYKFKNKHGKVFEADFGDLVADEDGRSGKLVHVDFDDTLGEQVLVVDPGYGIMIELVEHRMSFVYKEGENA